MKKLISLGSLLIYSIVSLHCDRLFAQNTVPDYINDVLKANPVKEGTFRNYNFNEAKLKPKSVIELDLNEAGLTKIPDEIQSFENIEVLDLGFNEISELPIWLLQLKKLKRLILTKNKLNTVPEFIFAIKSLEYLDLSNNQIQAFEIDEKETGSLKEFDLSFNELSDIPESMIWLKSLAILRIENNRLKMIPKVIGDMKSLKNLDIYHNQVTDYNNNIADATGLEILFLAQNPIHESKIAKLKSLIPKCKVFMGQP